MTRGTTNRNQRGGAPDRRVRKLWLLAEFGDGVTAACALGVSPNCQRTVQFDTITVDRFPVPGCQGGTYRRGNIRPACGPCNTEDGSALGVARRREKAGTSCQT